MKKLTYSLLLAVLACAGCKTVNTVEPAQPSAVRRMITDKRVITDRTLDSIVHLVGINEATGPDGFLRVQLEVQNVTSRRHTFTYRVEWLDDAGMEILMGTPVAIPWSLEGKEISMLRIVAPTPVAKDFRIKFLESVR